MAAIDTGLLTAPEMLRAARERADMTQSELGSAMKPPVNRNTIGAWEDPNNTAEPRVSQFAQIAQITKQPMLFEQLARNTVIPRWSDDPALAGQMTLPLVLNKAA